MWEISSSSQIISFLYSLLIGILLSVFFDFYRVARKLKKFSKTGVFFQDIAFWIVATFVTFLLLMARCNGEVRGYILIGELLGFFVYRLTLSPFVLKFLLQIFKMFIKIYGIYKGFIEQTADFLDKVLGEIYSIILKKAKKVCFRRKNS